MYIKSIEPVQWLKVNFDEWEPSKIKNRDNILAIHRRITKGSHYRLIDFIGLLWRYCKAQDIEYVSDVVNSSEYTVAGSTDGIIKYVHFGYTSCFAVAERGFVESTVILIDIEKEEAHVVDKEYFDTHRLPDNLTAVNFKNMCMFMHSDKERDSYCLLYCGKIISKTDDMNVESYIGKTVKCIFENTEMVVK